VRLGFVDQAVAGASVVLARAVVIADQFAALAILRWLTDTDPASAGTPGKPPKQFSPTSG